MRRSPCGVCRSVSSLCASYRRRELKFETRCAILDQLWNADPMGEVTIEVRGGGGSNGDSGCCGRAGVARVVTPRCSLPT